MKQNKLTVLEKNHLRMILKNLHYNFLTFKELELFLNFLTSFLSDKRLSNFQKKECINLIEKLSVRNSLNKNDKKLLALLLFIDKKRVIKKYENNLNYCLQSIKNALIVQKNNSKIYLFKISLFIAFFIQLVIIKSSAI